MIIDNRITFSEYPTDVFLRMYTCYDLFTLKQMKVVVVCDWSAIVFITMHTGPPILTALADCAFYFHAKVKK